MSILYVHQQQVDPGVKFGHGEQRGRPSGEHCAERLKELFLVRQRTQQAHVMVQQRLDPIDAR